MAKYNSLNQNKWVNFQVDQDTYQYGSDQTVPIVQAIGGIYRAAQPTYSANDAVVAHFDVDGYLMCALKSGITVGGDLAVDVWSFRDTAGTDADAWVYGEDEALVGITHIWQGIGGYDKTGDTFKILPINVDHALAPAVPHHLPFGGEYRAAADTYDDGDAVITHYDVTGHLITTNDSIYAEDAQHTSGEEGAFVLGIRTDTLGTAANIAGTDADYMGLQMNAKGSLYTDVSSVLGSDMAVTNGVFSVITDNTTAVVVETAGTKKALNVNVTDGTNDLPTMDVVARKGFVAITDGTSTVDIGIDESAMAANPEFVPIGGEYRASDTTYTDGDATVAQSDINGHLKVRARGYDAGTDSQKVFEVSPVSQQFVSESLVDTTNLAADTNYYPSSTGATMDGYSDLSLTGKFIDADGTVTLTIEATNDEDTSGGDWIDITKAFYDAENNTTGNASYTVTNGTLTFAIDADNLNYRYYRVVVVNNGATNTIIVKARRKAI